MKIHQFLPFINVHLFFANFFPAQPVHLPDRNVLKSDFVCGRATSNGFAKVLTAKKLFRHSIPNVIRLVN